MACAVVYALADRGIVRVDGQIQGILSILVIGAATDYALLLTARFREELAVRENRSGAALAAVRRSFGAITASAATVALGLLALLASDLTNNRALGPVGAIGHRVRRTLRTHVPACRTGAAGPHRLLAFPAQGVGRVRARARCMGADRRGRGRATTADLGGDRARPGRLRGLLALPVRQGRPLDEIFVNDAPSVAAQKTLGQHFPGGSGNPAVIIADADRAAQVTTAARNTEGVASVGTVSASGRPGTGAPLVVGGRVRIDAVLEAAADSDAAKGTVARLRTNLHAVPGADALVGGYTAQQYDTQRTAARDRTVIVPIVLGIILLILMLLLRSLLVPLLLVATVGLNFLATLGVSALVFQHVLGFSGTDASVPLYGFVFLVALGVDYNIFLMSRVREEALVHGSRRGVLRGLTTTGGVITSAGVVLAATFAALMVIPLAFLVQIAFIVAFGVLLDTFVVRSLLVPALVIDIGSRAWWPSSLARDTRRPRDRAEASRVTRALSVEARHLLPVCGFRGQAIPVPRTSNRATSTTATTTAAANAARSRRRPSTVPATATRQATASAATPHLPGGPAGPSASTADAATSGTGSNSRAPSGPSRCGQPRTPVARSPRMSGSTSPRWAPTPAAHRR